MILCADVRVGVVAARRDCLCVYASECARDQPTQPATGIAGRLERARRNFTETFAFFAAGIFLVQVTHAESAVTVWAAWTHVVARGAYHVAYVTGLFLVRSLIWNVATFAIILLLLAPVVAYL